MLSELGKHCFLTEKYCNIPTDVCHPSCFVSIPFHLKDELKLIRETLENLGITPLIADKKPPQFLFHDICYLISNAMFGVFEVTETNENVFVEYGMMVEQGKPAILLYDKTKRKDELGSNMKGILQTRYTHLDEITSRLSETIHTLPRKMRPPDGSVLKNCLNLYTLLEKIKDSLVKKGCTIISSKVEIKPSGQTKRYLKFEAMITLNVGKGNRRLEIRTSPKIHARKEKVKTGLFELPGVIVETGKVKVGQQFSKWALEIIEEVERVIIHTLPGAEDDS